LKSYLKDVSTPKVVDTYTCTLKASTYSPQRNQPSSEYKYLLQLHFYLLGGSNTIMFPRSYSQGSSYGAGPRDGLSSLINQNRAPRPNLKNKFSNYDMPQKPSNPKVIEGKTEDLAEKLGISCAEVVTVLSIALGLKAAKDLGGGRFGLDRSYLPRVMEMLVSDGAAPYFPYMRTPKGLSLAARISDKN
jgi:hypothetical protein